MIKPTKAELAEKWKAIGYNKEYTDWFDGSFEKYCGYAYCLSQLKPFDEVDIYVNENDNVARGKSTSKKTIRLSVIRQIENIDGYDRIIYIGSNDNVRCLYPVKRGSRDGIEQKLLSSENSLLYCRYISYWDPSQGVLQKIKKRK
jgi:hypothetical protein